MVMMMMMVIMCMDGHLHTSCAHVCVLRATGIKRICCRAPVRVCGYCQETHVYHHHVSVGLLLFLAESGWPCCARGGVEASFGIHTPFAVA